MHISAQITIHILMGFLSCTYFYEWLSILFEVFVTHISVRMTIHFIWGFRHAHLFKNDYPDYNGFLSCTYFYEWLSILFLFFVMHIFVGMTIQIMMGFRHAHIYTNVYFITNFFLIHLCKTRIFHVLLLLLMGKTDEVEHHGVSLLVVSF